MQIHITNIYGMAKNSTARIAQNMVAQIGKELGFNEMGIYCYRDSTDTPEQLSGRLDGIIAALEAGDIVFFQSPSWNSLKFDQALLSRIRLYPEVKVITIIHDVRALMFATNRYLLEETIAFYNRADLLIVPSQNMYDFLCEHGLTVKKYLVQHLWDQPVDPLTLYDSPTQKVLNFAGDPQKFTFVNDWNYDLPLHLFAKDAPDPKPANLIHEGWKNSQELLTQLSKNGGFGLVWNDGGYTFEYTSKYIAFKLGTYLAAGLPVIVPKGISNEELILKNNLGFVVETIDEAIQKIAEQSPTDYAQMKADTKKFAKLLQNGYFTRRSLTDAIYQVLQK
ncbi:MAG: sugar transferase [Lactobacillus sp.]|nr:sugar transferase [Lactobacillus sp.]MBD5068817.1 sugar transferase [Lactobacillus sp.]